MKKKLKPLTPPDLKQCQAEIRGGSFMTLGPRPMERCQSKPTVVVTEVKPGFDGQKGSMSLCSSCLDVLNELRPGAVTVKVIDSWATNVKGRKGG